MNMQRQVMDKPESCIFASELEELYSIALDQQPADF